MWQRGYQQDKGCESQKVLVMMASGWRRVKGGKGIKVNVRRGSSCGGRRIRWRQKEVGALPSQVIQGRRDIDLPFWRIFCCSYFGAETSCTSSGLAAIERTPNKEPTGESHRAAQSWLSKAFGGVTVPVACIVSFCLYYRQGWGSQPASLDPVFCKSILRVLERHHGKHKNA